MRVEQLMVHGFHERFGFTSSDVPTLIPEELFTVRYDHTVDEFRELKDAYRERSLVKIADALTDSIYFNLGTADAFGIDLEPVFHEVHRSNMTKDRPVGGGDAKAVKGPNYSPPNLRPILVAQGALLVGRLK